MEERSKKLEAVGDGQRADHPLEGGVIMAERINRSSIVKEVEVKVSEDRVVMDVILEEREKIFGCERRFKVDFHELVQLVLGNRGEVVGGAH